ncbi:hypothetical protein KCP75_06660 [Salmonella enterica subsp. enterica]|nr:hypothetical protein KCP75_06660 [Salmonella enterica subsp. enterica]
MRRSRTRKVIPNRCSLWQNKTAVRCGGTGRSATGWSAFFVDGKSGLKAKPTPACRHCGQAGVAAPLSLHISGETTYCWLRIARPSMGLIRHGRSTRRSELLPADLSL